MEEAVIVLMLRDPKTGFLEKELESYQLKEYELLLNLYAEKNEQGIMMIEIKLSTGEDVSDWEYEAIFDHYNVANLIENGPVQICEKMEDYYNPCWLAKIPYEASIENKKRIENIIMIHKIELARVYKEIKDKKALYEKSEEE